MVNPGINRYKSVQVKTANPGDLLVMLFDGCFRFLNEALDALEKGDRARAGERLDRAYAILSEFVAALRPEVYPELCENLEGVYLFCMSHIVRANLEQDAERVREIVRILDPLRDAFRDAVHQVNSGQAKLEPVAR